MSNREYQTIEKLKVGNEDHKIKVRIMRLWRRSTKTGEEFKNFNLILLDHKVRNSESLQFSVKKHNRKVILTDLFSAGSTDPCLCSN